MLRNGYIPIATIFKVRNENKPNLKIRFNFFTSKVNNITVYYKKDKVLELIRSNVKPKSLLFNKYDLKINNNVGVITYKLMIYQNHMAILIGINLILKKKKNFDKLF